MKRIITILIMLNAISLFAQTNYTIVDTGQEKFYNSKGDEISKPEKGSSFYGQDAHFNSNTPNYTDNGDGTITDNITGLMWSKSPDMNNDGKINIDDKLSQEVAEANASNFDLAGYSDWRLPTIKELFSLIIFSGLDPSGYSGDTEGLIPFIDTEYFDFAYGDESANERIIDAQFATKTIYVSTTMHGDRTMFGVNFADGRIKGYPTQMPGGETKTFYVYYVRGNPDYGKNEFKDNGDNTISDKATDLMWTKEDSKEGLNWQEALNWVEEKNDENYLGYNDWRLPNVKELQSIVDYTRSPATSNSAAIDPIFISSEINDEEDRKNYPFYWSSTTHANMNKGSNAAYVAFGDGLGFMSPPHGGDYELLDVHGAGCQRSDPKAGNPDDYPNGHGPQGDVIRIYNYLRLVRDIGNIDNIEEMDKSTNIEVYPNPFQDKVSIVFNLDISAEVSVKIVNMLGKEIKVIKLGHRQEGMQSISIEGDVLQEGVYFILISADGRLWSRQLVKAH